jgi:hypothetical protein
MFLKTIEMMYQMEKDAGFFQSAKLHGGALRDTLGQLFRQMMLGYKPVRIRRSYLTNLERIQGNNARKAGDLLAKAKRMRF